MSGYSNFPSRTMRDEGSLSQTAIGLNSTSASDLRQDQFQNIFPAQQHFQSMTQQIPNPMMYVQRYPNLANAHPMMHQQYQVQQHLQQFNQHNCQFYKSLLLKELTDHQTSNCFSNTMYCN